MGKEIDDNEFYELLEEKRHKELVGYLKNVANGMNKPGEDKGVAEAIKQNSEATKLLIQAVKEIPKPEVSVELSQQEVVNSLKTICKEICDSNEMVIKALNDRPMVQEFEIARDHIGNAKTVKVIYKK